MKYGERYPEWGWCWVCQAEVKLFNSRDHKELREMLDKYMRKIKAYRQENGASLPDALEHVNPAAFEEVYKLTGLRPETQKFAFHLCDHSAERLGPPCWNCGKLLRTQAASYCPECMASRERGKFAEPMA